MKVNEEPTYVPLGSSVIEERVATAEFYGDRVKDVVDLSPVDKV